MDTEIDKAVSKLREVCGFRNSESATESFLDALAEAVKRTNAVSPRGPVFGLSSRTGRQFD